MFPSQDFQDLLGPARHKEQPWAAASRFRHHTCGRSLGGSYLRVAAAVFGTGTSLAFDGWTGRWHPEGRRPWRAESGASPGGQTAKCRCGRCRQTMVEAVEAPPASHAAQGAQGSGKGSAPPPRHPGEGCGLVLGQLRPWQDQLRGPGVQASRGLQQLSPECRPQSAANWSKAPGGTGDHHRLPESKRLDLEFAWWLPAAQFQAQHPCTE